ncbi:MAG TPA: copper-binding protein, partial [Clostridia bacterium]|nr:copper-binding protein [Clostridia bacterium]
MLRVFLCSIMVLAGVTVSCRKSADDNARASNASEAATNQRVFQVKGVVNRVKPDEKQVYIKHEAIPDYMPAMTMPFDVKDTNELAGLEPGQAITFRLIVTDTDGWIDQIRKVESAATNAPPANAQTRLSREVEP